LLRLDRAAAAEYLRSIGSHDPDLLDAGRRRLYHRARVPKYLGLGSILAGAALMLLPVGSGPGVGLIVLGLWMTRRGVLNLRVARDAWKALARGDARRLGRGGTA
jgi:hypothetical protein